MESIKQNLQTVFSLKPFEILFYGSRQRGDFRDSSDFNFFLLADPSDQLKSTFLRAINAVLSPLEEIAPVQLVTADTDSFSQDFAFLNLPPLISASWANLFTEKNRFPP